MANYTWPTSLPQRPMSDGFSEVGGVNSVRTPMDKGPAKIRRMSRLTKPIKMVFAMTEAQILTLDNFVENTIFGVRRFNFTHPRTGVSVEMRIVATSGGEMYTLTPVGNDLWTVSMQVEVMP